MALTHQTGSTVGARGGSDSWGSLWKGSYVPFSTHSVDPLHVVGHLGVDAQLVLPATALAPGHQTDQEPGVSVKSDHWSAAVPLTGVHSVSEDPGAEDVVGDLVGHLLAADAAMDQRDVDDVECRAEMGAIYVVFAPAGHHGHGAVEVEHTLGHLASWQASGDDVVRERGGGLQTQEGDVVVKRLTVVIWVFEDRGDLQGHFSALVSMTLVVT